MVYSFDRFLRRLEHTWVLTSALTVLLFSFSLGTVALADNTGNLGPNLARNGSFEQDANNDGIPDGWSIHWMWNKGSNHVGQVPDTAVDGASSLYVNVKDLDVPEGWGGRAFQDIRIKGGKHYLASVAIKMRNWQSLVQAEGVSIAIWWHFTDGSWSDTTIVSEQLFEGNFDWRRLTARFIAPEKADIIRLAVWANRGLGEIWWDDARLQEEEIPVLSPGELMQERLDAAMDNAVWSLAEVNWEDILPLRDQAQEAVTLFRQEDTPYTKSRAKLALDALSRALLGSRVAETRAYWIDEEIMATMYGRQDMINLLDQLQELGVNAIYPIVYYGGQTSYPSALVDQAANFVEWNEDPLAVLIEEAHNREMEVHAWYTVFAASHTGEAKPQILDQHPEWAAKDQDGGLRSGEVGAYWLDPANDEVQQFALQLLAEALAAYDLDGIHLDYIRYDGDLQFGQATVDKFRQATGADALVVEKGSAVAAKLDRFRQDIVTDFVKKVQALVEKRRPDVLLSAAVASEYEWALSSRMQRWQEWAEDGLVDFLVPMIYSDDQVFFSRVMDADVALVGEKVPMEVGIGTYMLSTDQLSQEVWEARQRRAAGVALFAAIHLQQRPEFIAELKTGVFRRPAVSVRNGQGADAFLHDLAKRLAAEAELFIVDKPEASVFRSLAKRVVEDPEGTLTWLEKANVPQTTKEALKQQLGYASYIKAVWEKPRS